MPPRRKRIRSDDSETSTVDSKGPSSGSDVQIKQSNRHQNKKVNLEDYDGDCESENPGRNRVKKAPNRSRILRQKVVNSIDEESSSSTPAPPVVEKMEVDQDMLGFERLVTPLPLSPIHCDVVNTPASLTPEVTNPKIDGKPPVYTTQSRPLFETPTEKSGKKFKRKRVAKHRQNRNKWIEDEQSMLAHFNDIENHELLIE